MNWKVFALLESSFCVLLSVVAIIYLLFVLTASGKSGVVEPIAIADIVVAITLTLVAHGQLIGSFRRLPGGQKAIPRPGSAAIPLLTLLLVVGSAALVPIAGHARWTDFARVYLTYAIVPPAVLALASRVLVAWTTRGASNTPLN